MRHALHIVITSADYLILCLIIIVVKISLHHGKQDVNPMLD